MSAPVWLEPAGYATDGQTPEQAERAGRAFAALRRVLGRLGPILAPAPGAVLDDRFCKPLAGALDDFDGMLAGWVEHGGHVHPEAGSVVLRAAARAVAEWGEYRARLERSA